MLIMLGEKLKELREAKGLVQRQVAAKLKVDTAYISKMENSEKPISRSHLKKLSRLYSIDETDLLTLWLADKVLKIIANQKYAGKALMIVQNKTQSGKK